MFLRAIRRVFPAIGLLAFPRANFPGDIQESISGIADHARIVARLAVLFLLCLCGGAWAVVLPGDLLVVNDPGPGTGANNIGSVLDIDPHTGAQRVISTGGFIYAPVGMCLDLSGNIILAASSTSGSVHDGALVRIDPNTGQQALISSGGLLSSVRRVHVNADGNYVVTAEGSGGIFGSVILVNATTGAQSLVSTGLPLYVPVGVTAEPSGNYLVANFQSPQGGSAILRIDAQTGAQTTVSAGDKLTLGPEDVILDDTQPNNALVAMAVPGHPELTGVLNVNTITGAQSVLSFGGPFSSPYALAQDSTGYLYGVDHGPRFNGVDSKVVGIDPSTGIQNVIASGGALKYINGIVVVVPEPGAFIVGLTGLLFLSMRRVGHFERVGYPCA